LAEALRKAGHRVELDGRGGSLKSMLRRANGMAARLCLVLGDTELAEGRVQCKDLARHQQEDVRLDDVAQRVTELLALPAPIASGDGNRAE
jgi:histidyl-tRNA synthetase